MDAGDLIMGLISLSQTTLGILGNFSFLYHFLFLSFSGCRLRPTDLITKHLTIANYLFLLFRGVPQTILTFGFSHFLSDLGCKLVFNVHRVGRGVSISITCLLSVFQAITLIPWNSRWAKLKAKAPRYTGTSIFLCWSLHILVNVIVPLYVTGKMSNKNITKTKDFGYYYAAHHDKSGEPVRVALLSFLDILCLGIMPWSSGSMVFILNRHKQRVQHIHGYNLSSRSSPEFRATKTVFLLVCTFVTFYTVSLTFHVCLGLFSNTSQLMVDISAVSNAGFPTVSPFVLMSGFSNECKICFACMRIRTFHNFLRNM
ncbi:vomeronasal type-1 receptor 4-like [Castor canadensis]|uniref:vomeronasal type-1 receptor 4-like n=1 Tax=Castor canadensis TaxID=51338 RepID=UPI003D16592B